MGMTKASLDLQMQQATNHAIATLQKNMDQLNRVAQIIDGNMRQSHAVVFQDVTQLRVRVNFLMKELKDALPEDKQADLELRFKAFSDEALKKLDKDISDAIAMREKAQDEYEAAEAAKKAGGPGDENTPNVIQ
jgi:hypothetical protein